MSDDIYVVVSENNLEINASGSEPFIDEKGPIVLEQYTREASLENALYKASRLQRYGKTRIAKLVFVDTEEGARNEPLI